MKNTLRIYALLMTLCALTMLVGCGQGPKGDRGARGSTGFDGSDGQDANPVRIVKLCDGTTTYPTQFVEIGFCVDSRLYATFSANGGFSTELPRGEYSSNAIGSSCNFKVGYNCEITH